MVLKTFQKQWGQLTKVENDYQRIDIKNSFRKCSMLTRGSFNQKKNSRAFIVIVRYPIWKKVLTFEKEPNV